MSTSSSSLRLRKEETEERRTDGETTCSQVQVVGGGGNLQVSLPVSLSLGPEEGMNMGKTCAKRETQKNLVLSDGRRHTKRARVREAMGRKVPGCRFRNQVLPEERQRQQALGAGWGSTRASMCCVPSWLEGIRLNSVQLDIRLMGQRLVMRRGAEGAIIRQ